MKCISFTRRHVRVLVMSLACVGVLTCVGARVTRAQEFGSIERDRAKVMLSSVKNEITKSYYDPAYHGVDVEARFKAAEEKLNQATSMGQVFGIIAQAVLDLNDSHTFFIPPQRAVSVEYGWEMAMIGDKCYVVAIRPGSDAATKLQPGDEVLAIDERQPTRANLWKMQYLYHVLRPQPGLNLVVQSPGAQPRQLNVLAKVKEGKRKIDLTFKSDAGDYFDLLREDENDARLHAHRYFAIGEN